MTFNQVVRGSSPRCLILMPAPSEGGFFRRIVCGHGGIGRRAGFRFQWATVQVQVLLPALKKLKHDAKAKMIEEFRGLLPSEAGPLLFTERLVLHPLFDYDAGDEGTDAGDENPGKRLWYVPWGFSLRSDADNPNAQYLTTPAEPEDDYDDFGEDEDSESEAGDDFSAAEKVLGTVRFSGMPVKGLVEIKFAIEPEYEGQGYTTEALRAAIEWLLHQKGVKNVEAETETKNGAARRVLEKLAFQPCSMGEATVRYRLQLRK